MDTMNTKTALRPVCAGCNGVGERGETTCPDCSGSGYERPHAATRGEMWMRCNYGRDASGRLERK